MTHRNGPNPAGWDATGWLTFLAVFIGGTLLLTGGERRLPTVDDLPGVERPEMCRIIETGEVVTCDSIAVPYREVE